VSGTATTTPAIMDGETAPDYDVIVVGGGPAGCAFVRTLAADGFPRRLLLLEGSERHATGIGAGRAGASLGARGANLRAETSAAPPGAR
jgi:2-polyprenyl-6-methoxyphenol hydroxylase-like FAD-dependent oxidoreductase